MKTVLKLFVMFLGCACLKISIHYMTSQNMVGPANPHRAYVVIGTVVGANLVVWSLVSLVRQLRPRKRE